MITGIIISELDNGKFSIIKFYERRARRILPALFFVMICCFPFAWFWMLPSQFDDFSKSVVAVTFFSSNILFWLQENYFAPAADLKPLLHTWSLGVEEQYYIFFPIVLILLWRFGRRKVFGFVFASAIISFALSEWGWRNEPSASFYLAPTRAWELFAGSICAFISLKQESKDSHLLSLLGFGLIVYSIFFYDSSIPFPSAYALAPVVGTILVILFAGPTTIVAKLLSTPIFVGIGLISYSTYLWHQPLFAFARILHVREPDQSLMAMLAALSIALAYLSWRFVEIPARSVGSWAFLQRKQLFTASIGAGAFFAVLGLIVHWHDGFPTRPSAPVDMARLNVKLMVNQGLHPDCDGEFNISAHCATSSSPELMLWGDSYAMHLAYGLIASEPRLGMRQHTKSTCAPVIGISIFNSDHQQKFVKDCMLFNDQVFDWLKNNSSIRYVVLSSQFTLLSDSTALRDGSVLKGESAEKVVREALLKTVLQIRATGRKVIIISPTPHADFDIGLCLMRQVYFRKNEQSCDFSLKETSASSKAFNLIGTVSDSVPVMRLDEMICDGNLCRARQGSTFIFRDQNAHLSIEGSEFLGRRYRWMDVVRSQAR